MVIASGEFEALASRAARSQGLPDARIVTVAHPIGGVGDEVLKDRAEAAVDAVLGLLGPGRNRAPAGGDPERRS